MYDFCNEASSCKCNMIMWFLFTGEFSPLPPPPPELDDHDGTYDIPPSSAPSVPSWVPENYEERGRLCRFSSAYNIPYNIMVA